MYNSNSTVHVLESVANVILRSLFFGNVLRASHVLHISYTLRTLSSMKFAKYFNCNSNLKSS